MRLYSIGFETKSIGTHATFERAFRPLIVWGLIALLRAWKNNSGQTGISRHHGGPIEDPHEIL